MMPTLPRSLPYQLLLFSLLATGDGGEVVEGKEPAGGLSKATGDVSLDEDYLSDLLPNCPKMLPNVYEGQMPRGRLDKSLKYEKVQVSDRKECIKACCLNEFCQVAFMVSNVSEFVCFICNCETAGDDLCLPVQSPVSTRNMTSMVLVRPSNKSESWNRVLNGAGAVHSPVACQLDKECGDNEMCEVADDASRFCKCQKGYVRNKNNYCVEVKSEAEGSQKPTAIVVQVSNKNVTLPKNTLTLTAGAMPEAKADYPYSYEWTLLSKEAKGEMENSHDRQMKVTLLQEGQYAFKVVVTSKEPPVGAYGETVAYVNVFPAEKQNSKPKAVVEPTKQNLTLPTKKAILDGSMSEDDQGQESLSYEWVVANFPLTYKVATLPSEPTITLEDLVAGDYTIKLTVTDKEGLSDSTEAQVVVLEGKDYPPVANAGEDLIVYLPNDEVYLHSNGSSDDHGIVSWEWINSSGNKLASDTTNMRSAHPHLTHLEAGTYKFTLRVTDIKGQSDEDSVNVYVKPPSNSPPKAVAGNDINISLPRNWVILNGSGSTDDMGITNYNWSQVHGPNNATLIHPDRAATNVTGLTKGTYGFQLTVVDAAGNVERDDVTVTVKQDNNMVPVAKAGEDFTVNLPKSVVIVNGSGSTDDLNIVRWEWTRLPASLAAGRVIGNSSQKPELLLSDLVPGQYLFQLQVWDDQGKSDSDTVSINVHNDPNILDIIEVVLNEELTSVTQGHLDSFCQSIELLLRSSSNLGVSESDSGLQVRVMDTYPQRRTGLAIVKFVVEILLNNGTKAIMKGIDVLDGLESKLKAGEDVLSLKFTEVGTLVCQNGCSDHGSCQQATRECICESFWVENFFRRHLMDGKPNCDWSVIYVGIFLSVVCCGIICGSFFICHKKKASFARIAKGRSAKTKHRYSRLHTGESGSELRKVQSSSLMISESDSDSGGQIFNKRKSIKKRPVLKVNGHNSNTHGGTSSGSGGSSSNMPPPTSFMKVRKSSAYSKTNNVRT